MIDPRLRPTKKHASCAWCSRVICVRAVPCVRFPSTGTNNVFLSPQVRHGLKAQQLRGEPDPARKALEMNSRREAPRHSFARARSLGAERYGLTWARIRIVCVRACVRTCDALNP